MLEKNLLYLTVLQKCLRNQASFHVSAFSVGQKLQFSFLFIFLRYLHILQPLYEHFHLIHALKVDISSFLWVIFGVAFSHHSYKLVVIDSTILEFPKKKSDYQNVNLKNKMSNYKICEKSQVLYYPHLLQQVFH